MSSSSWSAVEELIPHRGPMSLIDSIVRFDGPDVVCTSELRADTAFVREGRLPPLAIVEQMAQAVAVWYGLSPREGHVRDGVVVALHGVEFDGPVPAVGDALKIEAHRLWDDGTVGRFACQVSSEAGPIGRATVVVLRREPKEGEGEP